MKLLIVNADDFGLTPGINRGIVETHQQGVVTSATLMANGEAFDDAVLWSRRVSTLGIGVHLSLIGGRPVLPVSEVRSLVGQDGQFPSTLSAFLRKLFFRTIDLGEVERELRAQIQKVQAAGIQPTHLDTHKHVHLHPRIFQVVARLGSEFGIRWVRKPFERIAGSHGWQISSSFKPASWKQGVLARGMYIFERAWSRVAQEFSVLTPDYFVGFSRTGAMDEPFLAAVMESLEEGITEIMCHPGWRDTALNRVVTRLHVERESELKALCGARLRSLVAEKKIELSGFKNLPMTSPQHLEDIWSLKRIAQTQ